MTRTLIKQEKTFMKVAIDRLSISLSGQWALTTLYN